jgi:2-phospho-L-lactate/phosphoenolpyruvate guanylyltransferase
VDTITPEASRPAVLVIPVKSFAHAKQRLSPILDGPRRARLGRELATRLLLANRSLDPIIVSDDHEVEQWAQSVKVRFLRESRPGLNQAVTTGHAKLRSEGVATMVVAHSDLAHPTNLEWVTQFRGITLVPDRLHDGTNIMAIPTNLEFEFTYGIGSFARHYRNACRTGLPIRIVADRDCGADIDSPTDLRLLRSNFKGDIAG